MGDGCASISPRTSTAGTSTSASAALQYGYMPIIGHIQRHIGCRCSTVLSDLPPCPCGLPPNALPDRTAGKSLPGRHDIIHGRCDSAADRDNEKRDGGDKTRSDGVQCVRALFGRRRHIHFRDCRPPRMYSSNGDHSTSRRPTLI